MEGENRRTSIRLPGADYSVPGFYFITVCTTNRENLFGEIQNAEMVLSEFGKIVQEEWEKTVKLRPNVVIDECMIMPNHFHGIVEIIKSFVNDGGRGVLIYAPQSMANNSFGDRGPNGGVYQYAPTIDERPFVSPSQTVGAIVRGFKSSVTAKINTIRQTPGAPVWQRNYFEHIIRTEKSLERIRVYIRSNPFNWQIDLENNQFRHLLSEKEREKKLKKHYLTIFLKKIKTGF